MLRRTRTAKKLAKRINMQYFTRSHPLRRWKFLLTLAAVIGAGAWVLSTTAAGDQKMYSSGAMSPAHAVFGKQCGTCHVKQASFREHVTDKACLTCHDAPQHNVKETFTPQCGTCHVEHEGRIRLARVSDQTCTQCHADLQTKDGKHQFNPRVTRFSGAHPQFAPLKQGVADSGKIKLNHYVHLQPVKGPDGKTVQLDCNDCHRTAAQQSAWRYGTAQYQTVAATTSGYWEIPRIAGAYMQEIKNDKQCAACHNLQFDKRFNQGVPHDKPEVIEKFLVKTFTDYIAAHPAEVHMVEQPPLKLPGRELRPAPRNAAEWIEQRVADSKVLLWNKTCKECHTLTARQGKLPEVAKPNITARWLSHSTFDHTAHRMMTCESCHANAPKSKQTADILLPKVEVCEQCHRSPGSPKENAASIRDAAEGRCFECHSYHDWSKAKPTKGKFSIHQLLGLKAEPGASGSAAASLSGASTRE